MKFLTVVCIISIILILIIIFCKCQKEHLNNKFFKEDNFYLNLFNDPLFNYIDDLNFVKTKHNNIYEKLKNNNISICIVGNGPLHKYTEKEKKIILDTINNSQLIIRFNHWEEDTDLNIVGDKCDICIVNNIVINNYIKNNKELKKNCLYINCECNGNIIKFKDIKTFNYNVMKQICNINPSRGFFIILLLINFYKNIKIIGFGGKGHHYNKNNPMYHNQYKEHEYLKKLISLNKIQYII